MADEEGIGKSSATAYKCFATPTFALLDADGQVLANVPGWSGYQAIVTAFDQLLSLG